MERLWTVGCSYCTPADVVHPQPGKSQTACATVQGHLVHYAEVVFWMYKKGGPQSMNAVVHLATKDAVDSP